MRSAAPSSARALWQPTTTRRRVAGGLSFKAISTIEQLSCAVDEDGAAYRWGSNSFGQLGNGLDDTVSSAEPVAVVGGHTFAAIDLGRESACGLTTDGDVYCWGRNAYGHLGTTGAADFDAHATPEVVLGELTFALP